MTHVHRLLHEASLKHADRVALRFLQRMPPGEGEISLTYRDLLTQLNRSARLIRRHLGGERGVVSLVLPNIPQAQVLLWAAEAVGVAQPLNPLLSEAALFELMRKAKSRVIVAAGPQAGSDVWHKVQAVAARLPHPAVVFSVGAEGSDADYHYDHLLAAFDDGDLPEDWLPQGDAEIAACFHTGGTTGTPRLARHTHANQVAAARAAARCMGITAGESIINGLPLFHVAGAIICSLAPLSVGATIVLPTAAGFRNPEVVRGFWKMVECHRVAIGGAIPTSLSAIAQIDPDGADISCLRYFLTGGAPVPDAIGAALQRLTGRPTYQMYGLTECAGVVALPGIDQPPVPRSAGRVEPPMEVRIEGTGIGEICVRGPTVFAGYVGEPSPVSRDGWLRTGDLGSIDADGNVFITGRAKDLIIRGGHNIDPAMIEACLQAHPDVLMAAAVGWPDAYAGELPVAYVQLRERAQVQADALREFVLARIDERPACPKHVFVLPELPLTAVGKIHKPTLRAMAARAAVSEGIEARFPGLSFEIDATPRDSGEIEVAIRAGSSAQALREFCEELSGALKLRVGLSETFPV